MQSMQKLRALESESQPRGVSLAVGAGVAAIGLAYLFVLAQSGVLRSVDQLWARLPTASGPSWALPAVAAGVSVAGISVGVVLLSAFTQRVAQRPFLWLGPVLVGFSMIVLGGMHVTLPWTVLPYHVFVMLTAPCLLGGGAVLQTEGWTAKLSGGLVISMPLIALISGYSSMPGGLAAAGSSAPALFWFVLAITAAGVAVTALVARSETERGSRELHHALEEHRLRLVDALERNQWTEARLAAAERRAAYVEQGYGHAPSAEEIEAEAAAFASSSRPRIALHWVVLVLGLFVFGIALGTYFGVYRPMMSKVASQQALVHEAAQGHAAEIDTLRAHWKAEKEQLEAALVAARAQNAQPKAATPEAPLPPKQAAPAAEPSKPAAAARVEPTKEAKPETKAADEPKPRAAKAKLKARVRAAAKQEPAAAPVEDFVSAEEKKAARALRESYDDDPIGGLE